MAAAVRDAVEGRSETWTPADIIRTPRQPPIITGDSAVFHAIKEAHRAIQPLGNFVWRWKP